MKDFWKKASDINLEFSMLYVCFVNKYICRNGTSANALPLCSEYILTRIFLILELIWGHRQFFLGSPYNTLSMFPISIIGNFLQFERFLVPLTKRCSNSTLSLFFHSIVNLKNFMISLIVLVDQVPNILIYEKILNNRPPPIRKLTALNYRICINQISWIRERQLCDITYPKSINGRRIYGGVYTPPFRSFLISDFVL